MSFILKFAEVAIQPSSTVNGVVKRAVGFLHLSQIFPILDQSALAPNPRAAKRNAIVESMVATLNEEPELFRFKSKGLLLSSNNVEELNRKRFRVEFNKAFSDGCLDGGHNLFALALFVLSQVMDPAEHRKLKTWDQLQGAWNKHRDDIEDLEFSDDVLISAELIFPTSNNSDIVEAFDQVGFDVSQARNANTTVQTEAFQNKLGFYDVLKASLPEELSERVEWKPGEVEADGVKPINVRDIIGLSWIPLNKANEAGLLPIDISVLPQNIYRNKGECSDKFKELMTLDLVTEPIGGKSGQARMLIHKGVESCLKVAAGLPNLYDLIYEQFPKFYNAAGFRFGSRNVVKLYNPTKFKELKADGRDVSGYTSVRPLTPYFQRESSDLIHKYPEALIIPFVTALSALMKIENEEVVWVAHDIEDLVLSKLEKAAPLFEGQFDAYDWDPQRLAKSPSSHRQAASYYSVL
ncbi:MAG: hypothetical protein ACPG42_01710 [Alphaproteobacteria bacterium]